MAVGLRSAGADPRMGRAELGDRAPEIEPAELVAVVGEHALQTPTGGP